MITVPIVDQFDSARKIGTVTIDETKVRDVDMVLSMGYRVTEKGFEIICFGMIDATMQRVDGRQLHDYPTPP